LSAEIERRLRSLRLSGMASVLSGRLIQAEKGDLTHLEFLELLISDELDVRRDRLFERRLKKAKLPCVKSLSEFDFSFNPKIPKRIVLELGTARFVKDKDDLLLIGPSGVGKSHIAISLAVSAITAGHTALHTSTFDLVSDIAQAEATGEREELVKRLSAVDLLIIEDLGMKRLPAGAAEYLLEVVYHRYEKRSTIITTNRPVEDWGKVLGDAAAAGAILDRFLHHAEVITITGPSYRLHERKRRASARETVLDGQKL
jgi:DNA replication protein DnaC